MKTIIILFFLTTCLTFAIPSFESLGWGFTIDAIKGFYPEVEREFTPSSEVTKYNYYPKDTDTGKIVFYLVDNQLYKIITIFDPTKIKSADVEDMFNDYSKQWGTPVSAIVDSTYEEFSLKENEQTWIVGTTYISLIGQDYFDNDNNLTNSKLIVEYGLIDPAKRKRKSSLNNLILDKNN
ncbi:hypothetical protein [Psychrilyobacter sp.]|uniref:hypothetical protein n=1 Tax=Psychrilyobacter sp. TaxID=2586924 RepID=UPI00301AE1C4